MLRRVLYLTAVVSVLGVMGFGASEASAARDVLPRSNCEDNNWCTQPGPGDEMCNACCPFLTGGLCVFYGPPEGSQGCVCYGP
jgi:hypothetical protein